jgi:hypothetical protein
MTSNDSYYFYFHGFNLRHILPKDMDRQGVACGVTGPSSANGAKERRVRERFFGFCDALMTDWWRYLNDIANPLFELRGARGHMGTIASMRTTKMPETTIWGKGGWHGIGDI